MSIADKLSYLQTTKEKIKNALGDRVTDTTPFRKYADEVDFINLNLDNSLKYRVKEEAEGTEMTLTNCAELLTEEQEIWSNGIEQESRSGKNFANIEDFTVNAGNGVTFGKSISNLKENTTYTLSFTKTRIDGVTISNENVYGVRNIYYYNTDTLLSTESIATVKKIPTNGSEKFSTTITTPAECNRIIAYFDNTNSDTNNNTLVSDVQLEAGSTATDFEPYGAMPSLDYPSDIYGVTGDVGVKVQNKNILVLPSVSNAKSKIDNSKININYTSTGAEDLFSTYNTSGQQGLVKINFDVPNGTQCICSIKQTKGSITVPSGVASALYIRRYDKGTNKNNTILLNTYIKNNFTNSGLLVIDNDKYDYYIQMYCNGAGIVFDNVEIELQAEQGSTATDYIEHQEQTYPLSLGNITLYGNDTVRDSIVRKDGKWYLHKEWKKYVFTDGEFENIIISSSRTVFQSTKLNTIIYKSNNTKNVFSNYFKSIINNTWATIENNYNSIWATDLGKINLILSKDSSITTITALNEKIKSLYDAGTPMYIIYRLATPIETEITDTTLIGQLNDLTHLSTYEDYTYITVTPETENSLTPVLKLDYYKTVNPETKTGHIYTAYWSTTSSNPVGNRDDDAQNLVANAHLGSLDTIRNDFDNIYPWSSIRQCNIDIETDKIKAWYGDADFTYDGTNGDVYTYIPEFWYKRTQDDNEERISIADYAAEGFTYSEPFFVSSFEGSEIDSKMRSYSGLAPSRRQTISSFRTKCHNVGEKYYQYGLEVFSLQLLYLVEYANRDSQTALGRGIVDLRRDFNTDKALIAESSTNRIVISSNNFIVGQQIALETSNSGENIANNRTITDITSYSDDSITGYSITFNGSAVPVTTSTAIISCGQTSGQNTKLGISSGYLGINGKSAMSYRGIENWYGNLWKFVDGINIKDCQAYICKNPDSYTSDKFDGDYKAIGYVNNTTNGYISGMGYDSNNSNIMLPIKNTGSSNTYYSDYYWQITDNSVAIASGGLDNGSVVGAFFWRLSNVSSHLYWNLGCRIVRKI